MVVRALLEAGQITVSWSHDLTGPPAIFVVERRYAEGQVDWMGLVEMDASAETQYTVIDVDDPGAGVQYRVNAVNDAGTSAWSESNWYIPLVVPTAPTDVVARV